MTRHGHTAYPPYSVSNHTVDGMRHRDRHPGFVDGCDACRYRTIALGHNSTTTGGRAAEGEKALEQRWERDRPAYKRLRQEGLQPKTIRGSADIEARAETRLEVETGHLMTASQARQVADVMAGGDL